MKLKLSLILLMKMLYVVNVSTILLRTSYLPNNTFILYSIFYPIFFYAILQLFFLITDEAMTNKVENVNSQLRDKISYLVRRTKAYAKSEEWLNYRLAIFLMIKILVYMTSSSVPLLYFFFHIL